MPPRRRVKKGQGASPQAAVGDRLSALPDELLHHVLSFLPAEDAVRTCLLARRWRHLWKSATGLHIVRHNLGEPVSMKATREFVGHLLRLREGAPLDTCVLSLFTTWRQELVDRDAISCFENWIRHILTCKVRVLSLDIRCEFGVSFTLISNHLQKLQLSNIFLDSVLLDSSGCPALEVLEIDSCVFLSSAYISSKSLKCLRIGSGCYFDVDHRIHFSTPNLHSLQLTINKGRIPSLWRMPFLVEAFVNLSYLDDRTPVVDCCSNNSDSGDSGDEDCFGCYEEDYDNSICVLLQGLSKAQNLVLRSQFNFRRDLKWRTTFDNLRTLLLAEYWCVPADFSVLIHMLTHSPILEKLTLELYSKGPKHILGMKGRWNSIQLSAKISRNLKIVDVKCEAIDKRVLKVFKFLGTLGISFSLDEVEILE